MHPAPPWAPDAAAAGADEGQPPLLPPDRQRGGGPARAGAAKQIAENAFDIVEIVEIDGRGGKVVLLWDRPAQPPRGAGGAPRCEQSCASWRRMEFLAPAGVNVEH